MSVFFAYWVLPVLIIALFAVIVYVSIHKFGRWLCDHAGVHATPAGCGEVAGGTVGTCPRCGRQVIRDSFGHWFDARH